MMYFKNNDDGSFSPIAPRINDEAPSDKTTYSGNKVEEIASNLADNTDLAPEFDSTSTYIVGDLVYYEGTLYRCIISVTTAGAWNAINWEEVDINTCSIEKSYINTLAPEFSPYKEYKVRELVTYKGRLFRAKADTLPNSTFSYNWQLGNTNIGNNFYMIDLSHMKNIYAIDNETQLSSMPNYFTDDLCIVRNRNSGWTEDEKMHFSGVCTYGISPIVYANNDYGLKVSIFAGWGSIKQGTVYVGFLYSGVNVEGIQNTVDADQKLLIEKVNNQYVASYPNTQIKLFYQSSAQSNGNAVNGGVFYKATAQVPAVFIRSFLVYMDENDVEHIYYSKSDVVIWR